MNPNEPSESGADESRSDDLVPPVDPGSESAAERAADALRMIARIRELPEGHEEAFFERDADTGDFAATRAVEGDETPSQSDTELLPEVPTRIGRFAIRRKLGEGGYGLVFLANDPQLKRLVALKIPQPQVLATEQLRARFVREAEAAAAVNHPNIVPVYETGLAGPVCYIAYAYIEGPTLATWLRSRQEPVDPVLAAAMVAALADAVQHAHVRGVLHRDLKPANILLEKDQSNEIEDSELVKRARITDFGLAKLDSSEAEFTRTGAIVGTPSYTSPEQAAGTKVVGPPADIYALGIILYEILTGRTPFSRGEMLATLNAIRHEEPAPLRRWRAGVPRDLEAVCMRCLEKQPNARYASASELSADLHRFLDGLPVLARPVSPWTRGWRLCRRNPVAASAIAAALVSLVVGLVAVGYQWQRAEAGLVEASHQRDRAERHLSRAQDAVEELLTEVADQLTDVPQLRPLQRSLLTKALELNREFLDDETDNDRARLAAIRAYRRMAEIHLLLGEREPSRAAAEEAIVRSEELWDGLLRPEAGLELAAALNLRGQHFEMADQLAEAEENYTQSANVLQRYVSHFPDEGKPQVLLALQQRLIAILAERAGRIEEAGHLFQAATLAMETISGDYQQDPFFRFNRAKCWNSLGIHLRSRGQLQQASDAYASSIELMAELSDEYPSRQVYQRSLAETYYNAANLNLQRGESDIAGEYYTAATAAYADLHRKFPLTPVYQYRLAMGHFAVGYWYKRTGDLDSASREYRSAIDTSLDLAERHPDQPQYVSMAAKASGNLSNVLQSQGRLDEAESLLRTYLPVVVQQVERYPEILDYRQRLASLNINLGALALRRQQPQEAKLHFERGVELQQHIVDATPENLERLKFLREDRLYVAEALRQMCEFNAMLEITRAVVEECGSDSENLLICGKLFCEAILVCEEGYLQLGESELQELRQVAAEAVAQAHKMGEPLNRVRGEKVFDVLAGEPVFDALISDSEQSAEAEATGQADQ